MSLISEVALAFKKHIFDSLPKTGGWRVLIMDDAAKKVLSCCFRMQDLADFGITLVESLTKRRKALGMEAIYILLPRQNEIRHLVQDFSGSPNYPAAHVFFLLSCPKELLQMISSTPSIRYFKCLVQLELNFIPVESHLYTLDAMDKGQCSFLPSDIILDKLSRMELLAEQLASVCSILKEYPKICYQKTDANLDLARLVQTKLDNCRADNPSMGIGSHKDQSILLIVNRGLDPVTPLLHELTLQAMSYDLLKIENDTYTYSNDRKANVTDQDPLWKELRHQHIADVTRTLPKRVREFADSKKQFKQFEESQLNDSDNQSDGSKGPKDTASLRDLSNLLKRMPQYQTEAASYSACYNIVEACMSIFQNGVDKLCELEQDLVMGQNAQGDPIPDPMRALAQAFRFNTGSVEDRLRILMIFVLIKEGVTEGHIEKLLNCAQVPQTYKSLFMSLSFIIGAQLIQPDPVTGQASNNQLQFGRLVFLQRLPPITTVSNVLQSYLPAKNNKRNRVDTSCYALSRWSPYLLDIMEQAISGKLDKNRFPFLPTRSQTNKDTFPALVSPVDSGTRDFKGPSARFHPTTGSSLGVSNTSFVSARSASPHFGSPTLGSDRLGVVNTMSDHCGPRLIVCVMGGLTWSEARSAYQLTQRCLDTRLAASDRSSNPSPANSSVLSGGGGVGWNWEVVIGGTHILTPKKFLDDLDSISKLVTSANAASEPVPRRNSIFSGFHRT